MHTESRLRDYIRSQLKFSGGNIASIPVGSLLLVVFTSYFGIFYLYSSWLAFIVTTVMNFWVQVLLGNIKVRGFENFEWRIIKRRLTRFLNPATEP